MRRDNKSASPARLFLKAWQCTKDRKLSVVLGGVFLVALMFLVSCGGTLPELFPKPEKPEEPAPKTTIKTLIPPEIELRVSTGTLSQSGLEVIVEANINNINSEAIDVDSILVTARNESGRVYIQDTIPQGSIAANSNGKITGSFVMPTITLGERITFAFDARAVSGDSTLPLSATFSRLDTRRLISNPVMSLSTEIMPFTIQGISLKLAVKVDNPNPMRLDIGSMKVLIYDQTGKILMTTTIEGGSIAPNSGGTFTSNIVLPFHYLNETRLTVSVDAISGTASISLLLNSTIALKLPKIAEIISVPSLTVDTDEANKTEYKWVSASTIPVLQLLLKASITNPNNIPLTIGPVRINIFKPDGTPVKSPPPISTVVVPPRGIITLSPGWLTIGDITPGAENLVLFGLMGKELTIRIDAEIGIERVQERIAIHTTTVFQLNPY